MVTGIWRRVLLLVVAIVLVLIAEKAWAGGSNYGTKPGALAHFNGETREWPVPTPAFARDPAVAPDGSIFIAVMNGNKVARFDPESERFREWEMPPGHRPHGLLVDARGIVWTTGNGNGTIGRLDPASGDLQRVKLPTANAGIRKMVVDAGGRLWYMGSHNGRLGMVR